MHPITAVQSEYSLWTRDAEVVTPAMAELGIGLVPFSPLGRGFLTGTLDLGSFDEKDFRGRNPRFQGAAGTANQALVASIQAVAGRHGLAAAQVALAWVHAQADRLGVQIAPIPGTKRVKWLEQNVAAAELRLTEADLAELAPLADRVVGGRY